MIWVGADLYNYQRNGGKWLQLPLRSLYVLLSATDLPAMQFVIGSLLASIFSQRSRYSADSDLKHAAASDTTLENNDEA